MQILSLLAFTAVSTLMMAQSPSPSPDTQAEQQVRQASNEEVQAFLHKDPEAMARL